MFVPFHISYWFGLYFIFVPFPVKCECADTRVVTRLDGLFSRGAAGKHFIELSQHNVLLMMTLMMMMIMIMMMVVVVMTKSGIILKSSILQLNFEK